jgi:hypothetical protein
MVLGCTDQEGRAHREPLSALAVSAVRVSWQSGYRQPGRSRLWCDQSGDNVFLRKFQSQSHLVEFGSITIKQPYETREMIAITVIGLDRCGEVGRFDDEVLAECVRTAPR